MKRYNGLFYALNQRYSFGGTKIIPSLYRLLFINNIHVYVIR